MYNEYYDIFIQNDRYDRFVDMKERTSSWRTREERFFGGGRMGKELKKAAAVAGTCAYAGGNGGEIRGADEESNRWDLKIRPL